MCYSQYWLFLWLLLLFAESFLVEGPHWPVESKYGYTYETLLKVIKRINSLKRELNQKSIDQKGAIFICVGLVSLSSLYK
jgi:hypothetical protein